VDRQSVAEAQAAPGAAHPAGGLLLVEAPDAGREDLVDGPGLALPRLVVGRGARQAEPPAEAADGNRPARREQSLMDLVHELASGNGFPRMSLAIIQTSFSMVSSPILASSSFFSALWRASASRGCERRASVP